MPPSQPDGGSPLTLGTAGHIDHGKTVLVRALTGVDTDRLPEEHERGISIELGFAPLELPSGRRVSVVDVPGHERFVRTMVAGATGVDLFLLVVAADDGVMPQTREHLRVLAALGVSAGVAAVTKADAVPPERVEQVSAEVQELVEAEVVAVSGVTGQGIDALLDAIDRAAGALPGRTAAGGPARLHIDRVFTLRGIGTVVTGTLWAGNLTAGETVRIEPSGREHRIRSLQVHGAEVERAAAGQRVAVALAGADRDAVERGDVLTSDGADVGATHRISVRLDTEPLDHGARVQIHHGTRQAAARVRHRDGRTELALERPLVAVPGDRFVVRSIAPPDTVGGGVVLSVGEQSRQPVEPRRQTADGRRQNPENPALGREMLELLREAGLAPPRIAGRDEQRELGRLAEEGLVVRCGPDLFFAADAMERARDAVRDLCRRDGAVTIASLRDALGTSRRYAQAILERLDGERMLVRIGDEHRLRGSAETHEIGRFR